MQLHVWQLGTTVRVVGMGTVASFSSRRDIRPRLNRQRRPDVCSTRSTQTGLTETLAIASGAYAGFQSCSGVAGNNATEHGPLSEGRAGDVGGTMKSPGDLTDGI